MNISISNIAWPINLEKEIFKILKKYSVEYIDIAPSKYFNSISTVTMEEISSLKNYFYTNKIKIAGMQSLLFELADLNIFNSKEDRVNIISYLTNVFFIADSLNIRRLVFGCAKNRNLRSDISREEQDQISLEFFLELGVLASNYNLIICIEPQPKYYNSNYIKTSIEARDFVLQVSHPNIRLQLDTGAMILNKEDPTTIFRGLGDLVGHIHLSEPNLSPLGNYHKFQKSFADLVKAQLINHTVTIEIITNKLPNPISNIEESIIYAGQLYRA